jgi:hypothetical protein
METKHVLMERDGERTHVEGVNGSVQIMEGHGWKVVGEAGGSGGQSNPQAPEAPEAMTAAQLKAELDAYRVDYKRNASKADLVEIVTVARKNAATGAN